MREIEEFDSLKSVLRQCLDMEVIHDQVIESHWDYRSKVEYWRMRFISNSVSNYVFSHEIRSSLNRLAFNVLNMGKLFLDKNYHEKKGNCFCFGLSNNESDKEEVRKHREKIYQENLEYVIGCKLRGGSQHQSLPVDRFYVNQRYESKTGKKSVGFGVDFTYEELVNIGAPKKMIDGVAKLCLTDILDGYVYAISQMQVLNRRLTKQTVSDAENKLAKLRGEIIKNVNGGECNQNPLSAGEETLDLSLEWFTVYEHLQMKHCVPVRHAVMETEKS